MTYKCICFLVYIYMYMYVRVLFGSAIKQKRIQNAFDCSTSWKRKKPEIPGKCLGYIDKKAEFLNFDHELQIFSLTQISSRTRSN